MKIVINILRTIIAVILIALLIFNGWLLVSQYIFKDNPPNIMGYSQFIVTSGSMQPTFKVGDVVVVKSGADYEIGDVITFRLNDSEELVTHRIVGSNSGGFITRGDANNVVDDTLQTSDNIVGKVQMSIPEIGNLLMFLKTPFGVLVLIVVGFLLIELPSIFSGKGGKAKGKQANEMDYK